MAKWLSILLGLFVSVPQVSARMHPGDWMVVGMNCFGQQPSDLSRDFSIVNLATIPAGTTVFITDRGFTNGRFTQGHPTEGTITLQFSENVSSGSVISIRIIPASANQPARAEIHPQVAAVGVSGWTSREAAPWYGDGDQLLLYDEQGQFISAFNNAKTNRPMSGGWNIGHGDDPLYSELPPGLVANEHAFSWAAVSPGKNLVYTGLKTGDKTNLLQSICTIENWESNGIEALDLQVNGDFFPGNNPVFTLSGLPVQLLIFVGKSEGKKHELSWQVGDEQNFSTYIVEQSKGNSPFKPLVQIPVNGTGRYQVENKSPAHGKNLYRLRIKDANGRFAFSQIVQLSYEQSDPVEVSQPSSSGMVQISTVTALKTVRVYALSGQLLLQPLASTSSLNFYQVDLSALPVGVYLLQIITSEKTIAKKIVKRW
jgi:hypothetical protein